MLPTSNTQHYRQCQDIDYSKFVRRRASDLLLGIMPLLGSNADEIHRAQREAYLERLHTFSDEYDCRMDTLRHVQNKDEWNVYMVAKRI